MPPVVWLFHVAIGKHGITPVDPRVGSWLNDRLGERRYKEKPKSLDAGVLKLLPSLTSCGAVL